MRLRGSMGPSTASDLALSPQSTCLSFHPSLSTPILPPPSSLLVSIQKQFCLRFVGIRMRSRRNPKDIETSFRRFQRSGDSHTFDRAKMCSVRARAAIRPWRTVGRALQLQYWVCGRLKSRLCDALDAREAPVLKSHFFPVVPGKETRSAFFSERLLNLL